MDTGDIEVQEIARKNACKSVFPLSCFRFGRHPLLPERDMMKCMLIQVWGICTRPHPWQAVDSHLCIWPSHIKQERELCTSPLFTSEISCKGLQSELIQMTITEPGFKNLKWLVVFSACPPCCTLHLFVQKNSLSCVWIPVFLGDHSPRMIFWPRLTTMTNITFLKENLWIVPFELQTTLPTTCVEIVQHEANRTNWYTCLVNFFF